MFVSVTCEIVDDDNREKAYHLLGQYGFKEILKNIHEAFNITEKSLLRLKRDIDRVTDYYDTIRFYQYPVDGTLVITFLKNKKWRKIILKQ